MAINLFVILLQLIHLPAHHVFYNEDKPYVMVLGVAQDGGYPHLGCVKQCCKLVWSDESRRRYVVSLALVDPATKSWWLFEATPDIREQMQLFRKKTKAEYSYLPQAIFITHAHIGHYTGLIQLGKEVMHSQALPVMVLPVMKTFLETNGPWSQLVTQGNIALNALQTGSIINLTENIRVQTFTVPHRDEFSETAGFKMMTSHQAYLFIPDIDKWNKWKTSIMDKVKEVNIAFLDGTFYEITELKNRKIEEVPHPLITETMALFDGESKETKSKIQFIHLNHTNALLWSDKKQKEIRKKGFGIAEQGKRY